MTKYAILTTYFRYGSKQQWVEKEKVRETCEEEKAKFTNTNSETYIRIEVINTDTGEIREYWNNHDNKINF